MEIQTEPASEDQQSFVLPLGSPLVQAINLLRGAQLFPNTEGRVEIGNGQDGGFYVIISGNETFSEDESLKTALQLSFDDQGQLFDFGIVGHDAEGKLVCNYCSIQGDPNCAAGWSEDEFGNTCPLCTDVESIGAQTAGVAALAELVGVERGKKPAKAVNEFKQPPRPTKERFERTAQGQRAKAAAAGRVKLPGQR